MCEPKVSIIVPAYNAEMYFSECLDSLLRQTMKNVEFIILNDGSTDATGVIADQYALQDERIRVIHQDNSGLSASRNRGMDLAVGEYILFLDSDDWIADDTLERLLATALPGQADIVMGNVLYCYETGDRINQFNTMPVEMKNKVLSGKECFCALIKHQALAPMVVTYLYRRQWLQEKQLRFESVLHEDELWTPVALCNAGKMIMIDFDFYFYRQHASSIMQTERKQERIHALLFVANRLAEYAATYETSNKENLEIIGCLWIKILQLYMFACELLPKIKDSTFDISGHYLYRFVKLNNLLDGDLRKRGINYYRCAKNRLRSFWLHKMKMQEEKGGLSDLSGKKVIVVYNTMWEEPLHFDRKEIPDDFVITTDRHYLPSAVAVIFHLPTLRSEFDDEMCKPEGQVWIAWTLECEVNYPWTTELDFKDIFDFWMSYHRGDDIVFPYYQYDYITTLPKREVSLKKQNKVCMFVSSPINKSKRIEFLKELMLYTEVDSYGRLFNNCRLEQDTGRESKLNLYSTYKFVIAFENAIAPDYVTEKFYDPLLAGTVPVYLGAPNIAEFAPGDTSFLDVMKFENPKTLAAFINACYEDDALYNSFFDWKKKELLPSFTTKAMAQQINPFVRLCMKVKEWQEERKIIEMKAGELGRIYFCSFGDSRFQHSRERITEQAESLALFEDIFIYNELDLAPSFVADFRVQLEAGSPGYGFWVWKPYVILTCLEKMSDGDVLLYTDMGCHLDYRGKFRFMKYWEEVKYNESGFLVSDLEPERLERVWTKGDLLDYFGVRNNPLVVDTAQYQSGIIFIRKEKQTIDIIKRWLNVYYDSFALADNFPSISPDMEGFKKHRHDQSMLSVLLKLHGTSVIPLIEVYNKNWPVFGNEYPILAKRDLCRTNNVVL